MKRSSFKRHRFPPEIIYHAVWVYARFTLSFRDVEEMLSERGINVSNETVRRWFLKFGNRIAANLRKVRPRANDRWHLDEMVIVIRGKRYWLWRAVDGIVTLPSRSRMNLGHSGLLKRRRSTPARRQNRCGLPFAHCGAPELA